MLRYALGLTAIFGLALAGGSASAKGKAGYTTKEVLSQGKAMAKALEMPLSERQIVLRRLESLVKEATFKSKAKKMGIRGVFAFQMGEGGFIVKVKEGKGRIVFKGENKTLIMALDATTVGAQIGGSSQWGLGVVLGLDQPKNFGGKYQGESYNATAGNKGVLTSTLKPKDAEDYHEVVLLATAKGLSAGAAGDWINIAVDR